MLTQRPTRAAFMTATGATLASIAFVRSPRRPPWPTSRAKAGTNQTVDHPLSVAMKDLWDAVRKETNGRVDVTVFPNNQLGGDTAMLSQLRSGSIQVMTLDGGILESGRARRRHPEHRFRVSRFHCCVPGV